jgi:putative transposase
LCQTTIYGTGASARSGRLDDAAARQHGCVHKEKRRFIATTDSAHDNPVAPNRAWVGDVTFVWAGEDWLYVGVLVDLFSRRLVGWATSKHNDTALALTALDDALRTRRIQPGLIHHTDRGSPYASKDYRAALAQHGMVASMSRTGDCWDNAVAESFFSTLKSELIDKRWFPSRNVGHDASAERIESFYDRVREALDDWLREPRCLRAEGATERRHGGITP